MPKPNQIDTLELARKFDDLVLFARRRGMCLLPWQHDLAIDILKSPAFKQLVKARSGQTTFFNLIEAFARSQLPVTVPE